MMTLVWIWVVSQVRANYSSCHRLVAEHPCYNELKHLAPQLAALKEKASISDVCADMVAALFEVRLDDPAATVRVEEGGAGDIESRTRFFKGKLYLQFLERRSQSLFELAKAATGASRVELLNKVKTNTATTAATSAKTSVLLSLFDKAASLEKRVEFAISDP